MSPGRAEKTLASRATVAPPVRLPRGTRGRVDADAYNDPEHDISTIAITRSGYRALACELSSRDEPSQLFRHSSHSQIPSARFLCCTTIFVEQLCSRRGIRTNSHPCGLVASAGSYAKALTYFYKTKEEKESIPHRVVTPAPRVVLVVVAAGVPEIVVVVIDVLVHLRHVPLVCQPVNLRRPGG